MKRRFGPRPTAKRAAWAARRETIVEAARRVLARHGYAGLGVRAVAREAGLHALTVFRHFPGRDPLVRELWRRDRQCRMDRLMASCGALAAGEAIPTVLSDHAAGEIAYRQGHADVAVLRKIVRSRPALRAAEEKENVAATAAVADTLRRWFPSLSEARAAAAGRIVIEINAHVFDVVIQHPALSSKVLREWRALWLGYFDLLAAGDAAGPAPSAIRPSTGFPQPQPRPRPASRRGSTAAGPASEADILDAGDAVLAARGVKGFTARAVARQAGVTEAAVQALFSDQTDLLRAIVARDARNRARLALPIIEGLATAPDLARQIRALLAKIREARPTGSWDVARLAVLARSDKVSPDDDWHDAWIVPLAAALGRRHRSLSSERAAIAARFVIITHLVVTDVFLGDFVASRPGAEEAIVAEWGRMLLGYVTRLGRQDLDPVDAE
jgi:AcrR family transcriptional regulator